METSQVRKRVLVASLILVLLAAMIASIDWMHARLSLLTIELISHGIVRGGESASSLLDLRSERFLSVSCQPASTALDSVPWEQIRSQSFYRLALILSLVCGDEDAVVKRSGGVRPMGYGLSPTEAVYVSELVEKAGHPQEALILRRSVPDLDLYYVQLGRIAIEEKKDEDLALTYFGLAEAIDPSFDPRRSDMYRYRCLIEIRDGANTQRSSSCTDFDRASRSSLSRILLGRSYFNRGQPDEAIAVLRDAIALDATQGDAYFWLGKSLLAAGDMTRGRNAFDEGLTQAATYPWNYLARAELAITDGDQQLAIQLLCQMTRLPATDGVAAARQLLGAMDLTEDEVGCDQ